MLLTSLQWGSGLPELALQEGFYQIQAEEGNRNWASSHADPFGIPALPLASPVTSGSSLHGLSLASLNIKLET